MEGAVTSLTYATRRMDSLALEKKIQSLDVERDDKLSSILQKWFLKAGNEVFLPKDSSQAKLSRPTSDGSISKSMNQLIEEATLLNIADITDVVSLINILKCFAWSLKALQVLAKKPLQSEIKLLLDLSSNIKLPNERAIKFLRGLSQRATSWQSKVRNILKPIPGETKPYNLIHLNELAAGARNIPMITVEETRLMATIEDQGTRHCICGGPGDGTFMLSCDKCERWFHGACVNIDQKTAASLVSWMCPSCSSKGDPNNLPQASAPSALKNVNDAINTISPNNSATDTSNQVKQEDVYPRNDVSLYAPDPNKLWPPIGIFGSTSAKEALGSDYGESDSFDAESSKVSHSSMAPSKEQFYDEKDNKSSIQSNIHSNNASNNHTNIYSNIQSSVSTINNNHNHLNSTSHVNENMDNPQLVPPALPIPPSSTLQMSSDVTHLSELPHNFHNETATTQHRDFIPENTNTPNAVSSYRYQ